METRYMYLQGYKLGKRYELEPLLMTKEMIVDFAQKYDPRDFHIDDKKAKDSRFGSIIASGFHTLVACWAQWVKTGIDEDHMIAGTQINYAKWLVPVYPGDILTGEVTITGIKENSSGKTGLVDFHLVATNQEKVPVLDMEAKAMVESNPRAI